mgnify:FL=1
MKPFYPKPNTISILLFISLLQITSSLDLIIDASLSSANGNLYLNLQSAINALLTDSSLKTTTNTITLLPNCVGKTQTLSKSTTIQGAGVESLTIQYQSPPLSVNDLSVCNELPLLSLTNNFYLYLNNFAAFSLVGLSIRYRWNNGNNYFWADYIQTPISQVFALT